MAGNTGSGSHRWVVFLVVAIALLFFSKYLLIGAQAVLGVLLPGSTPLVSQPEKVAAPEPTAYMEATRAPEPTRAVEVVVEEVVTAAPSYENITLSIWHLWGSNNLDAIFGVLDDYSRSHPGINFDLYAPTYMQDEVNTAFAAGVGPDIIAYPNDIIGSQAMQGNIVPLNDYGINRITLASTYKPAAVIGVTWQDQVWALPESQEGIALIYNKDLVSTRYLPTNPLDLDDLLAKAEQFATDHPGKTLICNQGFAGNDAYHVAPIFFGMGVPEYIDENGNVYLDTPAAVRAAQFILDLKQVSLSDQSYDICYNALINGEVGMWWTGPWAITGIADSGINYGILPMGRPFVGIKTLMLTRSAVERGYDAAALEFMQYFTSPEVEKQLTLANKTIPAATAALEDPEVARLTDLVGFGKALNLGVPMSPSPFSSVQWASVGDAVYNIWFTYQTPAEAMTTAQQAAEDAVETMR